MLLVFASPLVFCLGSSFCRELKFCHQDPISHFNKLVGMSASISSSSNACHLFFFNFPLIFLFSSFLLFICRHTLTAMLFFVVLSELLSDQKFLDFSIDVSRVILLKDLYFPLRYSFLPAGFPVYRYFEWWRIWLRPAIVLSFCFSFYHSSCQHPGLILLAIVKQLEVVDLHQVLLKHLKPPHLAIW